MKSIIVIAFLLTFYSCTKQDSTTQRTHFSFDNTAKEWFSALKINDTLKFLSNLGNTRIYCVSDIETTKVHVQDCSFITGNCIIYFDYDERIIHFYRVDSFSSPTQIAIDMLPPDSLDYKNLPRNTTAKGKIFGSFDDYNGLILNFQDIYEPVTFSTFTGATKTYNEVIKFNSNNSDTYYDTGWNRNYNIKEVWYDKQFGFVYFKDISGQSWVRQN